MDIEYLRVERIAEVENRSQTTTYGIVAVSKTTKEKLAEFSDVSLNEDFVTNLTDLLNSCEVELCHFFDVIIDELNR